MLIDFAKEHLHPASPFVVCLTLFILAVWLWIRPASRALRRFAAACAVGYWFLSVPLGANLLMWGLSHGLGRVESRADARGADAIVVLGGGAFTYETGGIRQGMLTPSSMLRALEGARAYRAIGGSVVFASGGAVRPGIDLKPEAEMIRDVLVAGGVPADHVVQESQSRTTREQAVILKGMLEARGSKTFVLVTSPTHMRRSLAAFRSVGLDPVASTAGVRSEHLQPDPLFMPTDDALVLSGMAIYDYMARIYYALHGWTDR